MATPNFDILHLRFARKIDDRVATAATDGVVYSILRRTDYLNQGSNFLQTSIYNMLGASAAGRVLQSIVSEQAINPFSSSGVSVATTYNNMPVELVKTGATDTFRYVESKGDLDNVFTPFSYSAFTIQGGKLYAYQAGTILNSGTGTFRFLKNDEGVQGTTDISISKQFWDAIVDMAISFALTDNGRGEKAAIFLKRATDFISTLK